MGQHNRSGLDSGAAMRVARLVTNHYGKAHMYLVASVTQELATVGVALRNRDVTIASRFYSAAERMPATVLE